MNHQFFEMPKPSISTSMSSQSKITGMPTPRSMPSSTLFGIFSNFRISGSKIKRMNSTTPADIASAVGTLVYFVNLRGIPV